MAVRTTRHFADGFPARPDLIEIWLAEHHGPESTGRRKRTLTTARDDRRDRDRYVFCGYNAPGNRARASSFVNSFGGALSSGNTS